MKNKKYTSIRVTITLKKELNKLKKLLEKNAQDDCIESLSYSEAISKIILPFKELMKWKKKN